MRVLYNTEDGSIIATTSNITTLPTLGPNGKLVEPE